MFELFIHSPVKMSILIAFFVGSLVYVLMNIKNPKKLYYLTMFYIPLSFKSLSGSLVVYLILFLYIFSLSHKEKINNFSTNATDKILVGLIFLASLFSLTTADINSIFYFSQGRVRLAPDFLDIITFLSCIAIYSMTKKYIRTREDLYRLIKLMVISASIASLAGYLQIINPENTYIFKYIVLGEDRLWAGRVAATMQGYEFLAEYTAIMILLTLILIFHTRKPKIRYAYVILIINFIIILTLTQVRGIYIALALTVVYMIFLMLALGRLKSSFKLILYSTTAIFLLVASILTIDAVKPDAGFVDRFTELKDLDISKGQYATRTGAWEWAGQIISHMSTGELLIGAGRKYLHTGKGDRMVSSWPHSLYLSYIMRDGYIGLFIFLIFLLWLYKQSLNSITRAKKMRDNKLFIIAIILNFILVLFIIDEAKIEFIRHDRSQNITWLLFGIIVAFSLIVKNEYRTMRLKRQQSNKPT
ncbi:MAG: hypothetical protein OQJ95_02795 [Kangiella sp.]|nr:hypothetical protein [Kangiella sp.]